MLWPTGPRVALALIGLGFLGLSLTVAMATPPWEANDEHDHARNIETLRSGRWYRITRESGLESNQPPLYYLAMAGYAEATGVASNPVAPDFRRDLTRDLETGVFPHDVPRDVADTRYVRRLRLPNIAFGLTTVLLTGATAALVTTDRWTPIVAAATCAFVPRFVFVSGVINNDNLANTLGALAVFLAVALVVRPAWASTRTRELGLCAALGVTSGAMVLTKASTYLLLPGIVVALVLAARREPDTFRRLATRGAITVGTALLVVGWWLGLTTHWYGDPAALSATHEHYAEIAPFLLIGAGSADRLFVELPTSFWRGFWYESGWTQFRWNAWVVVPFWSLLAVGIAGLAHRGANRISKGALPTLAVLAIGGPTSVWVLATTTITSQGRIAFVSLAAIATLYALGAERYRVPVAARFALPAIGVVGTAVALDEHVFAVYR